MSLVADDRSASGRRGFGPRAFLRLVLRETRGARGRLAFVVACLAVGVTAVTAVTALVDAIESAVRRDSRALLAADVAVDSRRALPDDLFAFFASRPEAQLARVVEMAAMVSGGAAPDSQPASRLVELKSVEPGYPFHGELVTDPPGWRPGALAEDELLAGADVLASLGVEVGGELRLGGQAFRVAGAILDEPDRVDFAMTLGPRLMLSPAGLERTGLLAFGSRVKHRVLVDLPGSPPVRELEAFVRDLRREVEGARTLGIRTAADPTPGIRRSLGRIEDFLGLVALLSLLLGGAGVALVVRLWMESRTPAVAVLRAVGMRPREVAAAYLANVLLLATLGCALGAMLGAAAPTLGARLLPDLVPGGVGIPWPAMLRGVALGLATAAGFALPPLTAVWRVPPARVLRAEATPLASPPLVRAISALVLVGVVYGAAWTQSGRPAVAAGFTAGVFVLGALLAGATRLAGALVGRLPRERVGATLRQGLAAIARPNSGTPAAAVALGAGVLVVVAMSLVSVRLRAEFLAGVPEDAPSVFLVDVQSAQVPVVDAALANHAATGVDSTPVVMARLSEVAGTSVSTLLENARGNRRWRLTREQRLSVADTLPPANELVDGLDAPGVGTADLWRDPERLEVSLEAEFAAGIGVGVGDSIVFDVQGIPLELVVTTLREVDWSTFRINFFVVVEPEALAGAPGWTLFAASVPEAGEAALQDELARAVPNVSVLRVRPLLEKVSAVVNRVALAVQVLGVAVILTGVAILAVAAAASAARRSREAGLLKALGVTRAGVARLLAVEHALVGGLAGALGGFGAWALAWAFLAGVLDLPGAPTLWVIPLAAIGGVLLAILAGAAATTSARQVPPLVTLR